MRQLFFLLTVFFLLFEGNTASGQTGNPGGSTTKSEMDSVAQQVKRLNYRIDSAKNALGEAPASASPAKKAGFLASMKQKGPQSYSTSRQDLVSTNWIGIYAMATMMSNSYMDMMGSGIGLSMTNMSLRHFSLTGFGEVGMLQGYKGRQREYIFNEQHVHAGATLDFYPHTFWGGMPENMLILKGGFDLGMRFLDDRYPQVKPIDRTLGFRWGIELIRPLGEDKAFAGIGTVAFLSIGVNVMTPVVKFGDTNTVSAYMKFSGSPFSKRKVIAPYYRKI